jgi:hypothetical protein
MKAAAFVLATSIVATVNNPLVGAVTIAADYKSTNPQ